MRNGALRIGRPRRDSSMVEHQVVESESGIVSHPKNSLSIASRGRDGWETFPKPATYCHLLPFWSRKTVRSVSTVSIHFLPFEGVPASLGPGLRTVSGAVRSLGAKLPPRANLSHDRRIRQQSENAARRSDR